MLRVFRSRLADIPTPLASLALGIASLGLGLENALPLHRLGQSVGSGVAVLLLLCISCKFVLRPGLLWQELKHPVLGSILPTFAMSLMLVSNTLGLWNESAGQILWICAVVLHLALMVCFLYFRLRSLALEHMVPSWFVPFVGIIVAAVTVPEGAFSSLAYSLLVFGMVNYAVMLPVMIYRLIFSTEVADAAKPTIAIMAAPASLALVGYLNLVQEPSMLLCSVLLGIAVLMTGVIYLAFFKLLRLPFTPAFAAYTFPMAVGATALYKVSERLATYPLAAEYAVQLEVAAVVEMCVATLIVFYVCLRYFMHYAGKWSLFSRALGEGEIAAEVAK